MPELEVVMPELVLRELEVVVPELVPPEPELEVVPPAPVPEPPWPEPPGSVLQAAAAVTPRNNPSVVEALMSILTVGSS